jgi:putative MATE family efflux protein
MADGADYMRIVGAFAFFQAISLTLSASLRSANKAIYPMLVTVVVNILNIIGNYSLIFGKFGFPELGVEGAAISTAFSRGVSMVILFIILFRKHIHRFPLAYFRPFPWIELRNLMKVGLPSAGEQLSYSSSQVVITFFINMLGVEALATRTYCVNIIMFVYLFSISMAQGGAICIGHLIGEKKPRAAFLLGKYVMKKSVMITFILSCILAVFGHTILSWLTVNPDIIRMGVIVLIIDTVLEIGRPINIFATNALRAAGDVNYPFYVGLIVMWSVAVGGGYLFGVHWAWGLCGMWVAFLLDENIRGIIFVRRWYSMKWVHKSFVQA